MSHAEYPRRGALVAVGTGIRVVGQLTVEAMAWMRRAERLLYIVADPVADAAIRRLNPSAAESLASLYLEGRPRGEIYHAMADRALQSVRDGLLTCLACYGHAAVFADPVHEAIRRARAEGFQAWILPGISAEDCLFADLGVDPAADGCQSYDATDFLLHRRTIDPSAALVLWQVGAVGEWRHTAAPADHSLLALLAERLARTHPADHVVYLYEAALVPELEPIVRPVELQGLPEIVVPKAATLYVPPSHARDVDEAIRARIEALWARGPAGHQA
jgi:uncharacterized protein YabN with tetrapyrrole methylase and pyrophosphatase domain